MNKLVPNDTVVGDIAVELQGVVKRFRQTQRSADPGGFLNNWLGGRFREVTALNEVNLRVNHGEILAYAGPNGAGKSTTIKLLSGLLGPDQGTVRVLGCDPIRDRVRYARRIGVVFGHRTELWWDHPVAASFEWKRVVWEIPKARYGTMVELVREVLGLGDFFYSLARELSLGQRMRAELGLALLHQPELIFLDEPTIGIDVLAKRSILEFLREWNRRRQVTVILTSHDMFELEQLAGRMVLIDRGRIAFDGGFDRLRREYGDGRRLRIETDSEQPPLLTGAVHLRSMGCRHEYSFDNQVRPVLALLQEASSQCAIRDVETLQPGIDEVIAGIYAKWRSGN
jgi:ABC-2 type transport system ATP-binding protein